MVTESQEYYNLLYKICSNNPPDTAYLIPSSEPIYSIDLETRSVESPEILGVREDHKSEIVYFKVPQYYKGIDLSKTSCVIEYVDASGSSKVYPVQCYDTHTLQDYEFEGSEGIIYPMMIIPWVIEDALTNTAGEIQYSFRFFTVEAQYINMGKISEEDYNNNSYYIKTTTGDSYISPEVWNANTEYYLLSTKLNYNLHTLPATSKVLDTLAFNKDQWEEDLHQLEDSYESSIVDYANLLINKMNSIKNSLDIYWEVL